MNVLFKFARIAIVYNVLAIGALSLLTAQPVYSATPEPVQLSQALRDWQPPTGVLQEPNPPQQNPQQAQQQFPGFSPIQYPDEPYAPAQNNFPPYTQPQSTRQQLYPIEPRHRSPGYRAYRRATVAEAEQQRLQAQKYSRQQRAYQPDKKPGFYMSGGLGAVILQDSESTTASDSSFLATTSFKTGALLRAAVGYHIFDNIRAEVEFAFRRNAVDRITITSSSGSFNGTVDSGMSSTSLLMNAFYDIPLTRRIKPFVAVGAGLSIVDLADDYKDVDIVPAYEIMGGVNYELTQGLFLGVDYSFFSALDPKFGSFSFDYNSHNVTVGLMHKF